MGDHDAFYKQVGEKIRAKRQERGLSQEVLAKAVGLKRPSMSNIEKGRQNILLHTFSEIVETLGTNASALLPEPVVPELSSMPDLRSYSKEVRAFLEAGIKTIDTERKVDHGDPTTEN